LVVIELIRSPPRCRSDVVSLVAIAMMIGIAARTSSPIWLRRRPPMSAISERNSLVENGFGRYAGSDSDSVPLAASAADAFSH
jgi:hypothetical protein